MKIAKIINNNVVSTCDEEGREIIVMGRGVGFKAKEGSTIDEEKVLAEAKAVMGGHGFFTKQDAYCG